MADPPRTLPKTTVPIYPRSRATPDLTDDGATVETDQESQQPVVHAPGPSGAAGRANVERAIAAAGVRLQSGHTEPWPRRRRPVVAIAAVVALAALAALVALFS